MTTTTMPARQQAKSALPTPQFDPKISAFGQILKAPNFRASLKEILPRAISPDRMVRVVLSAMTQQPKLLNCTPESVMLSVLRAASMGLEPDGGPLGQGYLVPFWNSKTSRLECQFIPGYRGLVKLARNSGEVADVWAEVVYEHDQFDYEKGLYPKLTHKRNDEVSDPGRLRYAYAVARFRDGERKFEVMNAREIEEVKQGSSSKNKNGEVVGPWVDHEAEMWKKTAVRRLAKLLPLATDPVVAQAMTEAVQDVATIDVPMPMQLQLPVNEAVQLPAAEDEAADLAQGEPQASARGDQTPVAQTPVADAPGSPGSVEDPSEAMPAEEIANLQRGADLADLRGLQLKSRLKAMFGKESIELLTPSEGKQFGAYLDSMLDKE